MANRLVVALVALLATLVLGRAPLALAAEPKRVVIGEITGKSADKVRVALVRAFLSQAEVKVIAKSHVEKTAEQLGVEIDEPKGARAIGAKLGVAALVEGEVKAKGKKWTAAIRVRTTADGEVAEAHQFKGSSADDLAATIAKKAWKQLKPAIQESVAPKNKSLKKRVVVRELKGPKAGTVREWMAAAIKKDKRIQVVSQKETKKAGLTKDATPDDLVAIAGLIDADAFVGGEVKVKGATTVEVVVINGADGEPLGEFTIKAMNMFGLKRAIDAELRKKLAGPLAESSAPAPPEEKLEAAQAAEEEGEEEEEQAEKEEPKDDGEEDDEDAGPTERPSPFEAGLGLRAFSRNFRYTDDLFDSLRSYKLGVAPAGFVWLRWYPVAHFTGGPASHFGLVAGYEQGFALKSEIEKTGESYDTSMREWYVGVRGRIPFHPHEVGVQLSYGVHSFTVDDDPTLVPPIPPDVRYSYIRLGVDGRVRVSRALVGAHIGYRHVRSAGEIESEKWFPRLGVGGVDAGVVAGYEILDGFDLLAGFDFRRYFYRMNPEPGDANVAGGALDEYIAGWGGVGYRLPGGP